MRERDRYRSKGFPFSSAFNSVSAVYVCVRSRAGLQIQTVGGYWLAIMLYRPIIEAKCTHTHRLHKAQVRLGHKAPR